MDSCAAEYRERKLSMGETGATDLMVMGRPYGGVNILQGGGSGDTTICVRDVGPFGINGEKVGRDTHWVP